MTKKNEDALRSYYKMLLGLEPDDPRIALLNPQRIVVSKRHDLLLHAAVNELHPGVLVSLEWSVWSAPRMPVIDCEEGVPDVTIHPGGLEFMYRTSAEEVEAGFDWDGFDLKAFEKEAAVSHDPERA